MKPRTKLWLVIGGVFGWLLIAGMTRDYYDRQFQACQRMYDRTGSAERWEACLDEAGVTRHGSPKRGLGQLVLLGR